MRDRGRDREREKVKERAKERTIATGIETERDIVAVVVFFRGRPFFSLEDAENDPKGHPFHRPWQREDGTCLHLSSLVFVLSCSFPFKIKKAKERTMTMKGTRFLFPFGNNGKTEEIQRRDMLKHGGGPRASSQPRSLSPTIEKG